MRKRWLLLSLVLLIGFSLGLWYWLESRKYYKNSLGMEFRLIPAGRFVLGSVEGEVGRSPLNDEEAFPVDLSRSFFIQRTEVTQAQWKLLMGHNPSHFQGHDQHPVENISYQDIQKFVFKLNQKEEGTYRLPTEAEWEYAARANTQTSYFFGEDKSDLEQYAWYKKNANKTTHPVGQKKPNPWGLYDMYGNVYEWVYDWYEDYPKERNLNPSGPLIGLNRVIRGGNWIFSASYCRSARRHSARPASVNKGIGFRLLREIEE